MYAIFQSCLIFAHIEVGAQGAAGAGGGVKAAKSTKQDENPFMAKTWLFSEKTLTGESLVSHKYPPGDLKPGPL